MPCYKPILKRASKPINPSYPKELITLGDHIRKKRLDQNLFQKDVAKKLHTTTDTITNWEKNRCQPELKFYPAIMDFLKYCPIQQPKTLGEKIDLYRIYRGLSIKKLGHLLDIDPGFLSRQIKKEKQSLYCQQKLEAFWEGISALKPLEQVAQTVRGLPNPHYPKELKTLGDHIRKRRLDLKLSQEEAAKRIGAHRMALCSWEGHRSEPALRLYPAVMEFLGYCPLQYPKTLGEKLNLYRIHLGFSFDTLGQLMGIDPAKLYWQMQKYEPSEYFQVKFEDFLNRCYEVM